MTESVSSLYSSEYNYEKPYPFLSKETVANAKSPFITDDMLPTDRPSPFLTKETVENAKSPFITDDMLPADRPYPFFDKDSYKDIDLSPLAVQRLDGNASVSPVETAPAMPKTKGAIVSELQRDAMRSSLTARDIAGKYGISYIQAQEIFVELNADSNGVVREFNLPQNSTVSYLV